MPGYEDTTPTRNLGTVFWVMVFLPLLVTISTLIQMKCWPRWKTRNYFTKHPKRRVRLENCMYNLNVSIFYRQVEQNYMLFVFASLIYLSFAEAYFGSPYLAFNFCVAVFLLLATIIAIVYTLVISLIFKWWGLDKKIEQELEEYADEHENLCSREGKKTIQEFISTNKKHLKLYSRYREIEFYTSPGSAVLLVRERGFSNSILYLLMNYFY